MAKPGRVGSSGAAKSGVQGQRPGSATTHQAQEKVTVGVRGLGPRGGMRNDPVCAVRRQGHPECSPEGIRTLATALRGRRPRPLDDGARTFTCSALLQRRAELYQKSSATILRGSVALGYQDSNLD